MLSALQEKQKNLKKTETNEYQGIQSNDEISKEDWYAANIELWYDNIESCTFKTIFVSMTREEGQLILLANNCYNNKIEMKEEDKELLIQLENKLDKEIKKFNNGSFVKLSCRSPKDATATAEEMIERYRNEMNKHKNNNDELNDNIKLIELFTSHIQILCSKDAKTALKWFIRSCRVAQDIELALKEVDSFPIQFIIREWIDIPTWGEFRGFVYDNKFVALSQYFDSCFFKELFDRKNSIQNQIETFFNEKLCEKVPLSNYIIDFAITSSGDVYVIELNPYNPNTDSCLFSWSRDASLLKNGPFEFRILEKPITNLQSQVLSCWKPFLNEEF